MKKIFFIVSFSLLFSYQSSGQAAVDIPVTVSDNRGATNDIYFGLDLTATDGLDEALGELELPSPQPGWYFAAWIFPDFIIQSYKDYRAPGSPPAFPFTGHKSHLINIQTHLPEGNPMTISWNLPSTIAATSTIGVTGNMTSFSGTGSHTWNYNPVSLSYIFVEIDYIDITPVALISFSGMASEEGVLLNWTTATELNNQGFEVERFNQQSEIRNSQWEKIGFVPGFGTTTEPKSYSFTDQNVTTGIYKYRLKQIDFDASFTYSNEIEVVVNFTPNEFVLYQNYPNPFNPSTKIKFEIPSVILRQAQNDIMVSLKVYDVLGNEVATLVNEKKQPGVYEVEFNLGSGIRNPASGIYFYQLKAGSYTDTKKMILLR